MEGFLNYSVALNQRCGAGAEIIWDLEPNPEPGAEVIFLINIYRIQFGGY